MLEPILSPFEPAYSWLRSVSSSCTKPTMRPVERTCLHAEMQAKQRQAERERRKKLGELEAALDRFRASTDSLATSNGVEPSQCEANGTL